jgi:DNA-binding HxlR family transcriptional regulator
VSTVPLARLSHNRWSLPVLAALACTETGGGRLANLTRQLGVSRGSLRRTLASLIEAGLVARNPGHGHPLRPDYVLTRDGRRLAPLCASLLTALDEAGLTDLARSKWPLPILLALAPAPARFSQLRVILAPVTARALTIALKQLESGHLIERAIVGDYPPRAEYRLDSRAHSLTEILERLPHQ